MCLKHGQRRFGSIHYQIIIATKSPKSHKNPQNKRVKLFDGTTTDSILSDIGQKNKKETTGTFLVNRTHHMEYFAKQPEQDVLTRQSKVSQKKTKRQSIRKLG